MLVAAVYGASAQNSTASPYSRFGYGLMSEQANTVQRSMGGVGYAMNSGRQINFMNPASYAAMDSLTFLFDMGLDIKSLSSTENSQKGSYTTGGLDYITLQVPLTKWLGASAGLIPYSEVGYEFTENIADGSNARNGSGTVSEFYLGFGARPFKGFSIGFNFSYLFGNLINDTYIYTQSSSTSLFERVIDIRDCNVRFGAQYHAPVAKDQTIGIGLVFSPKKSFHGKTYGIKYDISADAAPDTIGSMKLSGNAEKAALFGAGISYTWQNRLLVEADFTYEPWKNVKFATIPGFDTAGNFNNLTRFAIGAQYIHRPRGSWVQRLQYRIGAHYCNDYIKVGDNSVREKGISLGVGLPTPWSKTMLNLNFEWRNRQASPQPLLKENYFVVSLGINFNQPWFWRNKLR